MGTQGPELQEERRYKVTYHTYLASNCRTHQALSVPYPSEALAVMKVVFIVRARAKAVPREVLVVKTSQISIPRKLKVSLMTGSLVFLCRVERCYVAVMLMEILQKRTNIKSVAAALEAAWITGFNEKTIRGYRKEFFENHGTFMINREESVSDSAS